VNVPEEVFIKFPPKLSVPDEEKVILEATPADVIAPDAVTVPEEIVISVFLVPAFVPPKEMVVHDKLPEPTLSVIVVVGRGIVIPADNVTEYPFKNNVLLLAPVNVSELAIIFPLIVAVPAVLVIDTVPVVLNPDIF
jgi:hypothetical protein